MPLSYANLAYSHYAFSAERGSSSVMSRYYRDANNIRVKSIEFSTIGDRTKIMARNKIKNAMIYQTAHAVLGKPAAKTTITLIGKLIVRTNTIRFARG